MNSILSRLWAVWFKRPYKGPECVLEIIGADLEERSNSNFDHWSKPDIPVDCRHGKAHRKTQIEGNTLRPRFLYSAKLPYRSVRVFFFTVYDTNVVKSNEVIGRCFIGPLRAEKMIQTNEPALLSLGDGIGTVKVKLSLPAAELKTMFQTCKALTEK
jgi:hypothetical protein